MPSGNEVIHTSLNGIYWRVGEGTHRARDEADEHVLVRRQVGQFGLHPVRELLQLLVRREVRPCPCASASVSQPDDPTARHREREGGREGYGAGESEGEEEGGSEVIRTTVWASVLFEYTYPLPHSLSLSHRYPGQHGFLALFVSVTYMHVRVRWHGCELWRNEALRP